MACCGDFDHRSKFSGVTDRKKEKKQQKFRKVAKRLFCKFLLNKKHIYW